MRCSGYQGAFYSSGVACAHIEFLATGSAVEVARRPYRSSRFSALYLAHSFSVRLVTSVEAIPNRPKDRIVARMLHNSIKTGNGIATFHCERNVSIISGTKLDCRLPRPLDSSPTGVQGSQAVTAIAPFSPRASI